MGKKSRAKAERRDQVKSGAPPSAEKRPVVGGRGGAGGGAADAAPRGIRGSTARRGAPIPAFAGNHPLTTRVMDLINQEQGPAALQLLQSHPIEPGQEWAHRNLVALALTVSGDPMAAYPLLLASEQLESSVHLQLAAVQCEVMLQQYVHASRRSQIILQKFPPVPQFPQIQNLADDVRRGLESSARELGVRVQDLEQAEYLEEESNFASRERDYEKAEAFARQAVAACERYEGGHLALAMALASLGRRDEAIDELDWLSESEPGLTPPAVARVARVYLACGDRAGAENLAEGLRELPVTEENRPWKAETLALLEEHTGVRDLLQGAPNISPREQFLLAVARANLKEWAAARRALQTAMQSGYNDILVSATIARIEGRQTPVLYNSPIDTADPWVVTRFYQAAQGNEKSREELQAAAQERPELLDLARRLAGSNISEGTRLLGALGTEEALDELRNMAQDENRSLEDRLMALTALRDAGEIAEDEPFEMKAGDQALTVTLGRHTLVPDLPIQVPSEEIGSRLGEAFRSMEMDPERAHQLLTGVEAEWSSAQLRVRIAQLCQSLGRLEESEQWLNRALETNPQSVEARIGLAGMALNRADLKTALEHSRILDEAPVMTVSEFISYQNVRNQLNALVESPLADALLAQADLAPDEESAEANRELAGMLGDLQRSMALTQYLRQRPMMNLREDLTLAEVLSEADPAVIYNAAWVFGVLPEVEELTDDADDDDELDEEEGTAYPPEAREMLAREMLNPERLAEGLPGLPDYELDALQALLKAGGALPLEEYLELRPEETPPQDLLLEYALVVEGRLSGRLIRLIPVDLRAPLQEAMQRREEW